MFTTVILATVAVTFLVVYFLMWAILLRIGARWAKIEGVTLWRALFVAVLVAIANSALYIASEFVEPVAEQNELLVAVAFFALALAIPWMLIAALFKAPLGRAAKAWLPTLLAMGGVYALSFLVVRPFLFETFTQSTNGMAPTLLARHWRGECAVCGNATYCTPDDPRYSSFDSGRDGKFRGKKVICAGNYHTTQILEPATEVHGADHFVVSKFLSPRRWDIVVFRYPAEPETLYAKRLVGLPGEEVVIKDGHVWINGEEQFPPEELAGLTYASPFKDRPDDRHFELWATSKRPAKLAGDEYFVLGDFSQQSQDSRVWRNGAPGHAPFAVPKSHMVGVVTHIYWPATRWRAFR
jgi:signal peptidase I